MSRFGPIRGLLSCDFPCSFPLSHSFSRTYNEHKSYSVFLTGHRDFNRRGPDMRALVMESTGSDRRPRLQVQIPHPDLGPDHVLVKVLACGLNHADFDPQFAGLVSASPRIVGMDISGEIAEL